jgi:hypothetical protein
MVGRISVLRGDLRLSARKNIVQSGMKRGNLKKIVQGSLEILLLDIRNSVFHIIDLCFFCLHQCGNNGVRKDQCKGLK